MSTPHGTIGFTGTGSSSQPGRGMAPRQLKAVRQLFYHVAVIHLGDCIGADAEAYGLAGEFGIKRIGHPPSDGKKRAFLTYDEERPAVAYLMRNRHIVGEGIDGLIAAPKDYVDQAGHRGQGTWTTIGYARQARRRIWIVWPDGTFKVEEAQ